MNIHGYVPFLINTFDTTVSVIKISISFPTSILVISHSVAFC